MTNPREFSRLQSDAGSQATVGHHMWLVPGVLSDDDSRKRMGIPNWTTLVSGVPIGLSLAAQGLVQFYDHLDGRGYTRGFESDALQKRYRLLIATSTLQPSSSRQVQRPGVSTDGILGVPSLKANALSERETQILRCISKGCSNKEVARQLGISPSTVRTHVESMFRKLQCATRAAATVKALSLGLI